MSNIGDNPKIQWLNLRPRSADPTNPEEGDIYYSDGTPRAEGPYVYQNGSWLSLGVGSVGNIAFTPQSSDPGSPTQGMIFYADGTSRTEGFWFYDGTGWTQITGQRYEEVNYSAPFDVRAASSANVDIATEVENGDSFGGVTLATNDLILLKDQTTASENGVYIVQASGAALRSASYDSPSELSYAYINVTAGTLAGNSYFQTVRLSSLSDNQTWSASSTYSLTVPSQTFEAEVSACGGGAGAGSGAGTGGGSGGGGGGAPQFTYRVKVTPGDSLSGAIGLGGAGGGASSGATGFAGSNGGNTTLTGTGISLTFIGGRAGAAGTASAGAGGAGGANSGTILTAGGDGNTGANAGTAGEDSITASGGAGGAVGNAGAGGGGGGAGIGDGAAGGQGNGSGDASPGNDAANYGAGGGASGEGGTSTGKGGDGYHGYLRISWI